MNKKFCDDNIELFKKMHHEDKMSLTAIAEKFGKPNEYHKIIRRFKKHNIKILKYESRSRNLNNLNINFFKIIDSHEKAYWLGFLYADSSINYFNGHPSKITLALKDKDPVYNFKKAIGSKHKIGVYDIFDKRTQKKYKRYSLQVSSKHFSQNLYNQGLQGKGICASFPNIEKIYIWSFIRGLFDGDGCITVCDKKPRVKLMGTEHIISFIQNFLISEYGFSKTKLTNFYKLKNGNICSLQIYKLDNLKVFCNELYQNSSESTVLARKRDIFKKFFIY